MKNYDDVDKILCRYRHVGGGVAIERDDNNDMSLAICFGHSMPTMVIRRHSKENILENGCNATEYNIRSYVECPKKYAHMLYDI